MCVTVMRADTRKTVLRRFLTLTSHGACVMSKPVERDTANHACELRTDELESVSGGKPASNAAGQMFLVFTFKLVAVKTVS
jgi:hypothetical protein